MSIVQEAMELVQAKRQTINDWLDFELKKISEKLPTLIHSDPASFACGFNTGYKNALLALESIIEDGADIYKSPCWCGDKYHEAGAVCL